MKTTPAGDRTGIRSSTPLQVPSSPGHVRIQTHNRPLSFFEKRKGGHSYTDSVVSWPVYSGCRVISSRWFYFVVPFVDIFFLGIDICKYVELTTVRERCGTFRIRSCYRFDFDLSNFFSEMNEDSQER
jgi:hypothetical protein